MLLLVFIVIVFCMVGKKKTPNELNYQIIRPNSNNFILYQTKLTNFLEGIVASHVTNWRESFEAVWVHRSSCKGRCANWIPSTTTSIHTSVVIVLAIPFRSPCRCRSYCSTSWQIGDENRSTTSTWIHSNTYEGKSLSC